MLLGTGLGDMVAVEASLLESETLAEADTVANAVANTVTETVAAETLAETDTVADSDTMADNLTVADSVTEANVGAKTVVKTVSLQSLELMSINAEGMSLLCTITLEALSILVV